MNTDLVNNVIDYLNEHHSDTPKPKIVKTKITKTNKKIKHLNKVIKEQKRYIGKIIKGKNIPKFMQSKEYLVSVKNKVQELSKELHKLQDNNAKNEAILNEEIIIDTNNARVKIPIEQATKNNFENLENVFKEQWNKQTLEQIKDLFENKKSIGNTNQIAGLLMLYASQNKDYKNNKQFNKYLSRLKKYSKNANEKTQKMIKKLDNGNMPQYKNIVEFGGETVEVNMV